MKGTNKKYSLLKLGSAGFMILALLWLTISAPFVYASQEKMAKYEKERSSHPSEEEGTCNPFSNTTEEKTPTASSSFSEEYLHDHHTSDFFFSTISRSHKSHDADTYIAFHGELLVPPPNVA
jgi:hypothetical protein